MGITKSKEDNRKTAGLDPQFRLLEGVQIPSSICVIKIMQPLMRLYPCLKEKGLRIYRTLIPGREGNRIPVLIFIPEKGTDLPDLRPCLVYFHGGGFLFPAAPYHYGLAKQYALEANCVVIFPDYRLAPEYIYPAPLDDCIATYEWVLRHKRQLKIDSNRIALGGDSAGGTLAAGAAMMIRDRGITPPCFQMLIYPAVDRRMQTHSARHSPKTPVLASHEVKWIWQIYLPELPEEHPEYASPMEAPSLSGLPPAYIELADLDPLHDEGLAYGQKLIDAGGEVEINQIKGTSHGFDLVWKCEITRKAVAGRCQALRRAFSIYMNYSAQ